MKARQGSGLAQPSVERVRVFDFDGVIIRGDVTVDLIKLQLKRSFWLKLKVVLMTVKSLRHGAERDSRARMNRRIVKEAFRGVDQASFDELKARVVEMYEADSHLFNTALLEELTNVKDAVVATAADTDLVHRVLKTQSLGHIRVVGSNFGPGESGVEILKHNAQAAKITSLREIGINPPFAAVYTDSESDLLLACEAEEAVLVNPSRKFIRLIHEMKPTTEIEVWAC